MVNSSAGAIGVDDGLDGGNNGGSDGDGDDNGGSVNDSDVAR